MKKKQVFGNGCGFWVLTNSDVNFIVFTTMVTLILIKVQNYSFLVKLAVIEQ